MREEYTSISSADLVTEVGEDDAADGLAMEPDAQAAVFLVPLWFKDGKKIWLKISAAAVPKMKKSYH